MLVARERRMLLVATCGYLAMACGAVHAAPEGDRVKKGDSTLLDIDFTAPQETGK
jgi:hypothetical protein